MGDPKYLQIANRKIGAQNVSIQINGNDYPLNDVDDIAYSSPMNRTIVRGMGSTDTVGIETTTGNDQPDTYTLTTREIGVDLHNLLFTLWKKGGRVSLFYYDKEKKTAETINDCCVQNSPKQANMGNDNFYLTTITLGTFHDRD
jgi:hypothetical protein